MDFVFQTDAMAKGKSTNNLILLQHVAIYSLPFFLINAPYAIINGVLHFVIDWCTSKVTSFYWQTGQRHKFFVTIGIDQALHFTCLLVTYSLLLSNYQAMLFYTVK